MGPRLDLGLLVALEFCTVVKLCVQDPQGVVGEHPVLDGQHRDRAFA